MFWERTTPMKWSGFRQEWVSLIPNAEAQRPAVAGTLPPLVRNLYVSESETTNER